MIRRKGHFFESIIWLVIFLLSQRPVSFIRCHETAIALFSYEVDEGLKPYVVDLGTLVYCDKII